MNNYKPVATHKLLQMTKNRIVNEYFHALNKQQARIKELEKLLADSVPRSAIEALIADYSILEDDGTISDLRSLLQEKAKWGIPNKPI